MNPTKRRSLLQLAGLAPAAAAGLAITPVAQAAKAPLTLTRSSFAAHVGEDFTFEVDALNARAARLVKVEPLQGARDVETSFRLVFRVSEECDGLPQETYRVNHPVLGRTAMFVSPNDADGRITEAIFNRL